MKKVGALILFLLISLMPFYLLASEIEVTTFIFDPEVPQPGESVSILIRLANKSYDEDIKATCRLFIDGDLHDVKIVPITRRSSCAVSFSWTAVPGTHTFSLEMSYYKGNAEMTDTFLQYLTVPGAEEKIDYFSEAVSRYENGNFEQAKIMFEQAKRIFEEEQNMEQALTCEEYIQKCDQYIEANQLFQQAEEAYGQEDFASALTLYYQAKSLYESLSDNKASVCNARIQEIEEIQRKKAQRPYYLFLLLPVAAAVVAFLWLKRTKPPPPLPKYVPEHKEKKLFQNVPESEIVRELHRIESQLDTRDPGTLKSLVEDFKEQEAHFDKKEYDQQEGDYIKESLEEVKGKIRERGRQLQDIQKLRNLSRKCDALLNQPVGDLVDAYNRYAQLHNLFDKIPYLGVPEQEEVRAKLADYYQFIQQQARSGQSEMQ